MAGLHYPWIAVGLAIGRSIGQRFGHAVRNRNQNLPMLIRG